MGKTQSSKRVHDAIVAFATGFELENLQEMLDMGTSMVGAGLGYLDVTSDPTSDEPVLSSEDANRLTHGLAWTIVVALEDDKVEPLAEFLEAFVTQLLRKAATLSPENRSQVTIELAKFFGIAAAGIVASTMPYDCEAKELAAIAETISGQAIGATIQAAVGIAMQQMAREAADQKSDGLPKTSDN